MEDADTYPKQLDRKLTIITSIAIATVTVAIFCVCCVCAYRSFVSWLNEEVFDGDLESSWTTEMQTQNRKIKRKRPPKN